MGPTGKTYLAAVCGLGYSLSDVAKARGCDSRSILAATSGRAETDDAGQLISAEDRRNRDWNALPDADQLTYLQKAEELMQGIVPGGARPNVNYGNIQNNGGNTMAAQKTTQKTTDIASLVPGQETLHAVLRQFAAGVGVNWEKDKAAPEDLAPVLAAWEGFRASVDTLKSKAAEKRAQFVLTRKAAVLALHGIGQSTVAIMAATQLTEVEIKALIDQANTPPPATPAQAPAAPQEPATTGKKK
jgi:hypothetical protein